MRSSSCPRATPDMKHSSAVPGGARPPTRDAQPEKAAKNSPAAVQKLTQDLMDAFLDAKYTGFVREVTLSPTQGTAMAASPAAQMDRDLFVVKPRPGLAPTRSARMETSLLHSNDAPQNRSGLRLVGGAADAESPLSQR